MWGAHIGAMNKYQSLVAWQSAHAFVISTFRTTDKCYHARARTIFDQLRRAALSVELNLVEGYALDTNAQFLRHLVIARGSAAECECIIRIVDELGYLPNSSLGRGGAGWPPPSQTPPLGGEAGQG